MLTVVLLAREWDNHFANFLHFFSFTQALILPNLDTSEGWTRENCPCVAGPLRSWKRSVFPRCFHKLASPFSHYFSLSFVATFLTTWRTPLWGSGLGSDQCRCGWRRWPSRTPRPSSLCTWGCAAPASRTSRSPRAPSPARPGHRSPRSGRGWPWGAPTWTGRWPRWTPDLSASPSGCCDHWFGRGRRHCEIWHTDSDPGPVSAHTG